MPEPDKRDPESDKRDRADSDRAAAIRDATADRRDQIADARDQGADRRDVVAEDLRAAAEEHGVRDRADAAADRADAASDREVAAVERENAAEDRADASAAAERALETLEAMSEAFYSLDPDWRFTYLNPQGERILQRRSADLLGTVIWDEFPETVGTNLDDALRRAMREHEAIRIEFVDGDDRVFDVHLHPLPDGLAVYVTDITVERIRAERQQQTQRLETLGRVTASVAHDFNNLLSVINGYATMGEETSAKGEAREYFSAINVAGQKAMDLTGQLLGFGRGQPIAPMPIDVNEALEDLMSILCRLPPASVQIDVTYAPEGVIVCIDRSQLEQVLVNLVLNASDAIEGSGTIRLRTTTTCPGDHSHGICGALEVTDTGSGIDANVLPHIFDPYFTTKPPDIGTGLGLATVYGIVMQNQGTIAVDSTLGVGTTFSLCFPRLVSAANGSDRRT